VLVSDFNYHLPEAQIAQEPPADRAGARMLHLPRNGELKDIWFRNLPDLLQPDDLLVLNNTRVFPARLFGQRSGSKAQAISPQNPAARNFLQGRIEVLLTKQISQEANEWECLVRPGRKIGVGEILLLGPAHELHAEVIARGSFGERRIRFDENSDFYGTLERIGHMPLPPYIARDDQPADRERYQTVYAQERGSVAAPTAGLHFTPDILKAIRARGVEIAEVTLHVGLGTFQPVHEERVEDHTLHRETYRITDDAAGQLNRATKNGRRIVAVGTTAVRTLEFAARQHVDGLFQAQTGEADLFIYPGFEFRAVGALLTNFHLPQSTLLMLVSAFGGHARVMNAYRHAVAYGYRFYSYGDCMFVEKPA
jgi:S-adenosylmethionine:tRNA ribosyltransferase-isomerase